MIRLNDNETILAVYRRHWLIFAFDVLAITGIALFLLMLVIISRKIALGIWTTPFDKVIALVLVLLYHALWLALFVRFADYWLDVWVLTNERIIDIVQGGLFHREIAEFKLDKIQDITVDVNGLLPTLFHYGNLQIETAGFERKFVWRTVPEPQNIKNLILKAADEYKREEPLEREADFE